jgi:putative endopeptidase
MSLSAADRDESVDPGVDFYRYANGGWIDANPIPPGYGAWGSFETVQVRNEAVVEEILRRSASDPVDDLDRMLGDFFTSGMDVDAVEAAGLGPIRPLLDAIAALATPADVMGLLPRLHGEAIGAFFGFEVTVDHDDSSRYLLWLAQTGLGLPEREAYFADSEPAVALRAAYVDHVGAQLANVGIADAAALGSSVLDLEARLAELHLRPEEARDPGRTLNRHDLAELAALAPALDLPGYLRAVGAGAATTVNVQNPALFGGLADVIGATDPATLRAYLTFHVVRALADSLPAAVDDEAFGFYGRRLGGQQEQHTRAKRVIDAITADVGEALAQRYVAETFSPEAKQRALVMVDAILAEMRTSLETRPWMGDATRTQAIEKLDAVRVKIGYPDRWRDWTGLELTRDRYAENRLRATRFEVERQLHRITEAVDEDEWEMPPHVVNAYYHPLRNEIVFPAGILQPPMFDAEADDALNFGGIGTVIAHEITHGFDDQGRRFDARGAFRDWWTEADEQRYTELTARLVEQFDGYTVLEDLHVNGRLTLGENIADLGGLMLAARAHARVSAGAAPIDGLTPTQRFFLANASVWRATMSDELTRTLIQVDPHSPRHLRVRGPFSNCPAFQDAFGLADDAPMMRPAADRIEIW